MRGLAFAVTYVATRAAALILSDGGSNARIYAHFAELLAHGANPYLAAGGYGAIAARYADYPPIWMLLFGLGARVLPARSAVLAIALGGDLVLAWLTARLCARRGRADAFWTAALVVANPL